MHFDHHSTTPIIEHVIQSQQTATKPPFKQALSWKNWSGNSQFTPSAVDGAYYYMPETKASLISIIQQATKKGVTNGGIKAHIRVSGQRHSAPPLIVNEDKNNATISTKHGSTWVVDLSCYKDLGSGNSKNIVLNTIDNTVTVNTGITEKELDDFLMSHGYMLKSFTAGGFFSIGGITAIDAHGSSVNSSILASNVLAYTVINAKGEEKTYNTESPLFMGYNPLQFYRTSLGTLGVVTSVKLAVLPLPNKESLIPSIEYYSIDSKDNFIKTYKDLLFSGKYQSVESFYNPYATYLNIQALRWSINHINKAKLKIPPQIISTDSEITCTNSKERKWGAAYIPYLEDTLEKIGIETQNSGSTVLGATAISTSMTAIYTKMQNAIKNRRAFWLTPPIVRAVFMSYFIPLPSGDNNETLSKAWDALQVVKNRLDSTHSFINVHPTEFRFVRGSDAVLSGTYSKDPNQLFISIEVLADVKKGSPDTYPENVLDYFANIEKKWIDMGGFPHNGKMYGFYDTAKQSKNGNITGSAPFNENYIKQWRERKNHLVTTFEQYRKSVDPEGVFLNSYTSCLLAGKCNSQ